ncbi:kinase-like protein [Xylariaceae sp. FL0594]|nr:kinase-like protein [Xylariaceae sp. FL0594]
MSSRNQSPFREPGYATEDVRMMDDELSDDVPVGLNDDLERLEYYEKDGYHPVHIGDTLGPSGRYRVIHKLGHGGFGTVWLCRDMQDPGYVAVKVMTGDVTKESLLDFTLMDLDRSAPGAEYIAIPLDSFSVVGPNGSHLCIAETNMGPILRGMAYQSALVMSFLHKHGYCHGDFRRSNILVKLASINQLTEDELISRLGQPEKVHNYLPPEVLLEGVQENAIGPACDLWALGCTLFEIRRQLPLFYMIYDTDELLAEMVRFFGKPPQAWWDKWKGRGGWFDDQGTWLRPRANHEEEYSLEFVLGKPNEIVQLGDGWDKDTPMKMAISKAEQMLMLVLLYKLFRYEPEKRLSVEEVLAHEWFKMGVEDSD